MTKLNVLKAAFLAGCLGTSGCRHVDDAEKGELYGKNFQACIMDAKRKVFPAVAYIRGISKMTNFGETSKGTVIGSGVVITHSGEVLTNWHVVNKMKDIRCQLSNGKFYRAELIGSDKDTDLALLQLQLKEGEEIKEIASIKSSGTVKEGEFVMAMGAPWGLNRSVSIGIISCSRRYLQSNNQYSLWYQTDASISPGNSGGPLVDSSGEVIGINTLGASLGGALGFAIPYETIQTVVPRLRKYKKANWAWTGVDLQALNDFNLDISFDYEEGVIIKDVAEGSPADKAGLQQLDRIIKINGSSVTAVSVEDVPEINMLLAAAPFDKALSLEFYRSNKLSRTKLYPEEKGATEGVELELKKWNMTVKTINKYDNEDLYFYCKKGVYVFAQGQRNYYNSSGLQPNDIIVDIDGETVNSLDDIKKIYKEVLTQGMTKGKFIFTIIRNGFTMKKVVKQAALR